MVLSIGSNQIKVKTKIDVFSEVKASFPAFSRRTLSPCQNVTIKHNREFMRSVAIAPCFLLNYWHMYFASNNPFYYSLYTTKSLHF